MNLKFRRTTSEKTIQTQTAYKSNYIDEIVWNHSFEINLIPQSFERWPQAQLRIWKLDRDQNFTIHAFGSFFFPLNPGFCFLK